MSCASVEEVKNEGAGSVNQGSQESDGSASQKRAETIKSALKIPKTGSMIVQRLYIKRHGGMSLSLRETSSQGGRYFGQSEEVGMASPVRMMPVYPAKSETGSSMAIERARRGDDEMNESCRVSRNGIAWLDRVE